MTFNGSKSKVIFFNGYMAVRGAAAVYVRKCSVRREQFCEEIKCKIARPVSLFIHLSFRNHIKY